ncbi:6-pyruvoyl trahydropterin synthase family protein [Pontibacter cellulosilyticus]|uniref:6-carboxy-5,6,7,8-tetrahydropterin synthase n=1 Tax=Pontibacter cellulosilyticus TaxID=1720253 RepID=A0A923NBS5_9BACT|nr:6-carboxytetrahydropterin synthase [Pontibacter cellulosilyticus]MBC5994517.1 6-carboxytetrahydropterin synthase [Pontibacter cellulosilyticus]
MTKIRLTRLFTFEAAHALQGYDGACRNIHGHSYKLQVTIIGLPIVNEEHPKNGMVLDFGDLKQLVQETVIDAVDHALLLRADCDRKLIEALRRLHHKLLLTPYQPTCENMLIDFKTRLRKVMPASVELHSLKLWETQNAFAEWYASDEV